MEDSYNITQRVTVFVKYRMAVNFHSFVFPPMKRIIPADMRIFSYPFLDYQAKFHNKFQLYHSSIYEM